MRTSSVSAAMRCGGKANILTLAMMTTRRARLMKRGTITKAGTTGDYEAHHGLHCWLIPVIPFVLMGRHVTLDISVQRHASAKR